VGQRLAGTPREAYARDWAVKRLAALGLTNPHIEPYTMPGWVRGEKARHAAGRGGAEAGADRAGQFGARRPPRDHRADGLFRQPGR
jgi:hypothetical protein